MPGRYYITKQVGKGPVSHLFLALDATDKSGKGTEYHLVRYRSEYCAKEAFVSALEVEAGTELSLSHENILKLVDYGTWEDRSFLVYEKNIALSLSEALAVSKAAGKSIDFLVVAGLALQLLDSLSYAHKIGEGTGGKKAPVFQSGFSPESVELSSSGLVKVRGFSRVALEVGARPNFLDMATGRMPYLSPAIWAGQRSSCATDLYSLGALLWELLVGHTFSKGESNSEGAPPVFSLRPDIPRELDAFVGKLLSLESEQAFPSAADAKVALEKALFSLNAKVSQNKLAGWHRQLRQWDRSAGIKEEHEEAGGERKVIAEVVANRKLKVLGSSTPVTEEPSSKAATTSPEKAALPTGQAWEKSTSFTEVPEAELAGLSEKNVKKRKLLQKISILAGAVTLLAGCFAYFFFEHPDFFKSAPDVTVSKSPIPRELLAVFAYQSGGFVTVQGVRNENTKSFAHGCGEVGRPCFCEYLIAPDDTHTSSSVEGIYSAKYNLVQCPESKGNEKFVRISGQEASAKKSNTVVVRSSLAWKQVLGPDLRKARVRWVSQFSCDRTFLEGEGVGEKGEFSCPPLQKLGTLSAAFQFYSFSSEEDGDKSEPVPIFTSAVCGNMNISAYRCLDGNRSLQFGLYKQEEPPFTIPVSLTRAPVGEGLISVYGFAAEPDSRGLCPAGLVKLRQWTAAPPSIPGTTFLNESGQLNNRLFETQEPRPLSIHRQKNRSPCDGKGDCSFATLEEPVSSQSTPYSGGVELCVIPPSFVGAAEEMKENLLGAVKEKSLEAKVQFKTSIPEYEVFLNGKKVEVKNNFISVPLQEELKIEVKKQGYQTQRFTIPPLERGMSAPVIEAASVTVSLGTVDLASFPPSQATFFLGEEKIFSGPTPVNEKLPPGKYRVKMVDKLGTENEISVSVVEGKTVSVDHLLKKK